MISLLHTNCQTHVGIGIARGMRESNTRDRNYNYTATMANIRVAF